MTAKVHNEEFTIERVIAKCPEHVFSAWSDADKKRKWLTDSAVPRNGYRLEFRVGGLEYATFDSEMGKHENETRYFEIIANSLIVFAYSMSLNGRVHSVSVVTVRFANESGGTRLTYTEQMCVIEPSDGAPGREHGWNALLDRMQELLDTEYPSDGVVL